MYFEFNLGHDLSSTDHHHAVINDLMITSCIADQDHMLGRVVHGSDGPAGRLGSGRVTILPDFGGSGRVGSAFRIF